MKNANPKVEFYFQKPGQWQEAFKKLRKIALNFDLAEDLKWGHPCYTLDGQNIFLMHGFKEYCALLFFKGALMKDDQDLLVQQTENVQAGRQIRFTEAKEITRLESTLKKYIRNAIEVEKSGVKIEKKKTADFAIPDELQEQFNEIPELKTAFTTLTPGRQRGYILHFSGAKQSKTRTSRIEKCVQKILSGKGLDDE